VRSALADEGIFLFDTYVEAAARAHELDLISQESLERIRAAVSSGATGAVRA